MAQHRDAVYPHFYESPDAAHERFGAYQHPARQEEDEATEFSQLSRRHAAELAGHVQPANRSLWTDGVTTEAPVSTKRSKKKSKKDKSGSPFPAASGAKKSKQSSRKMLTAKIT